MGRSIIEELRNLLLHMHPGVHVEGNSAIPTAIRVLLVVAHTKEAVCYQIRSRQLDCAQVARLAMLLLAAVFKEFLPGYKTRAPVQKVLHSHAGGPAGNAVPGASL